MKHWNKLIILLIIGLCGCGEKKFPETKGAQTDLKAPSQVQFEGKAMSIVAANTNAINGTRESEIAYQAYREFWSGISGMKVDEWRCRYVEGLVWESRGDANPTVRCVNPRHMDSASAFMDGEYFLKFKLAAVPNKIYKGDLITFSGIITRGESTGYVPNNTNYSLHIDVVYASFGSK